ncbi:MAG: hypothetical protein WA655_16385 [Candidatus Korobacteraceae bacterium]
MRLSAVTLARVLAFVETFDLNPQGTVFFPDLVAKLVEKCGFQKFPQTLQDFDEQKGVDFLAGRWGRINIEKLTVYNNGILLDTRVSTSISEQVLSEALEWVRQVGVVYQPQMIKRKGFLSSFSFYSDAPLLGPTTAFNKLEQSLSRIIQERTGLNLVHQPTRLDFDFDRTVAQQLPIAMFTIQRRAVTPFSENKYFTEAPLRSEEHVALIEEFERDVLEGLPDHVLQALDRPGD